MGRVLLVQPEERLADFSQQPSSTFGPVETGLAAVLREKNPDVLHEPPRLRREMFPVALMSRRLSMARTWSTRMSETSFNPPSPGEGEPAGTGHSA